MDISKIATATRKTTEAAARKTTEATASKTIEKIKQGAQNTINKTTKENPEKLMDALDALAASKKTGLTYSEIFADKQPWEHHFEL